MGGGLRLRGRCGSDCLGHELRHLRRLAGARLANHDEDLVNQQIHSSTTLLTRARLANHDEDLVLRDGVHQLLLERLFAVNEQ